MREANRQRAHFAVIIGEAELEQQRAQLKNMGSGDQEEVAFDRLADHLTAHPR
jgi:histidyl-tRNA synthetase